MIHIESLQNQKIKEVLALYQSKGRKKQNAFIIEGLKMLREAKNWTIKRILVSDSFYENNLGIIKKYACEMVVVPDQLLSKISDTVTPQGILAVIQKKEFKIESIFDRPNPLIVCTENLQDPGNLGTIIRTADAVGSDGVILSKGTVDVYNPKVVRSTMGSLFHLPIIERQDLQQVFCSFKEKRIQTVGAHLKGKISLYEVNMKKGTAVVIGNEANGLSNEAAADTDLLMKIPMVGKAESLNAGVAGSIILYEGLRQRIQMEMKV